jgi:hypothetical protein
VDRGRGTPIWTVIIVLTSWGAIRVAQSAYWHRQSNVEAIKYDVANIRAATNSCKNLGNIAVFGNANGARLSNSIFAEPVLFDRTSSSVWTYLKDRKRNSTSLAYTAVVKTPILSANSLADKSSPETIIWRSAAHQYLSSDLRPVTARGSNSRMDIYAYSFWRGGNRNGGLAAAGQYGGSQSGIIATYRLGDTITKPALLLRTSFAPGTEGDREIGCPLARKFHPQWLRASRDCSDQKFRAFFRRQSAHRLSTGSKQNSISTDWCSIMGGRTKRHSAH